MQPKLIPEILHGAALVLTPCGKGEVPPKKHKGTTLISYKTLTHWCSWHCLCLGVGFWKGWNSWARSATGHRVLPITATCCFGAFGSPTPKIHGGGMKLPTQPGHTRWAFPSHTPSDKLSITITSLSQFDCYSTKPLQLVPGCCFCS